MRGRTEARRDILKLLLKRKLVELLAERELAVDALLRNVEVLHVEETILANSLDESVRELLVPLGRSIQTEVESDEVRPIKVLLRSKSGDVTCDSLILAR